MNGVKSGGGVADDVDEDDDDENDDDAAVPFARVLSCRVDVAEPPSVMLMSPSSSSSLPSARISCRLARIGSAVTSTSDDFDLPTPLAEDRSFTKPRGRW